jgi:hypothetical protein
MTEIKFQKHDAVELKGIALKDDYKWWSGYYVLEIEKDGSCLISRTYLGAHNITQLTWPYRVSPDRLRKPEVIPKLSVTGGIYSAKNFLPEYGAFMVNSFYRDENLAKPVAFA